MKRFIVKILWFVVPPIFLILVGLFTPTTPRASKSLLMSSKVKDSLLQNTPSPRIIFIGGSNLSFGLNSQTVKDSLHLNPINSAIHVSIGLKFMIDNTLEYIKAGDIIVLVPEYFLFYRDLDVGSEELTRIIFDSEFRNIRHLNLNQIVNMLPFLPKYVLTKLKISEYWNIEEDEVYSVHSFNEYGDTYTHWNKQQVNFDPYPNKPAEFNNEVLKIMEHFQLEVSRRKAILLVTYPCLQTSSYDNIYEQVSKVEQEYKKSKLHIMGSSQRYKMADTLMYNTPYHLNKTGVDYRTRLLIEDIKNSLAQINSGL